MPIHPDYQSISNFDGKSNAIHLGECQMGISDAMRVSTKLLKSPFSILRSHGYLSVVFMDDSSGTY